MKKFLLSLIICLCAMSANAAMDFSFLNSKSEVETFISNHNKALKSHDLSALRTYYDEDFVSVDGVALDDMLKMLQSTAKTFDNMNYSIKSTILDENDLVATVYMKEKTKAKIKPTRPGDKKGVLDGTSNYIVYLKKDDGKWKIVQDKILSEETSIKYGLARKSNIELDTPAYIKSGENYDISLKIDNLKNTFALGSISKEEISFPAKDYKEKFRRFSPEGELERVVQANTNNKNEYAMASVGFTRVTIDEINKEQARARIRILGVAYIIKRMNLLDGEMEKIIIGKKDVKG